MLAKTKKIGLLIVGIWSALVVSLTTGCASGGFKLTRKYAGFVNKQHIILRIVLYILTSIVFVVTLLVDMVVFNTMDFWEGRVSQGTYKFEQDDATYIVQHIKHEETGLRESIIQVQSKSNKPNREIILRETIENKIMVFVDGRVKATVDNIHMLPTVTLFNSKGEILEKRELFKESVIAATN